MSCQGTWPKKRWLSWVSVDQPTCVANRQKTSAGKPTAGVRNSPSQLRALRLRGYPASGAATIPVPIAAPPNSVLQRTASAAAIAADRIRLRLFFLHKDIKQLVVG